MNILSIFMVFEIRNETDGNIPAAVYQGNDNSLKSNESHSKFV